MKEKVLVLGASENPFRYSNKAIIKLTDNNYEVLLLVIDLGKLCKLKF